MLKCYSCPYAKCSFGCRTKSHHRARYAKLRRTSPKPKRKSPKLSNKINYQVLVKLGLA